jgi:hypothetical protein
MRQRNFNTWLTQGLRVGVLLCVATYLAAQVSEWFSSLFMISLILLFWLGLAWFFSMVERLIYDD